MQYSQEATAMVERIHTAARDDHGLVAAFVAAQAVLADAEHGVRSYHNVCGGFRDMSAMDNPYKGAPLTEGPMRYTRVPETLVQTALRVGYLTAREHGTGPYVTDRCGWDYALTWDGLRGLYWSKYGDGVLENAAHRAVARRIILDATAHVADTRWWALNPGHLHRMLAGLAHVVKERI